MAGASSGSGGASTSGAGVRSASVGGTSIGGRGTSYNSNPVGGTSIGKEYFPVSSKLKIGETSNGIFGRGGYDIPSLFGQKTNYGPQINLSTGPRQYSPPYSRLELMSRYDLPSDYKTGTDKLDIRSPLASAGGYGAQNNFSPVNVQEEMNKHMKRLTDNYRV